MENSIAEKLIELRISSRHACSIGGKGNFVTLRVKALYLLSKSPLSPPELMDKLCMVKSNLALLCNELVSDGLIEKIKGVVDRRSITYRITERGRNELKNVEDVLENRFMGILDTPEDIESSKCVFDQIINLLSFV